MALLAQAGGAEGHQTGTIAITNNGSVFGDGTSANPVVEITTDSTGTAKLTNDATGEIAPALLSTGARPFSIPTTSRLTITARSSATSR